MKNTESIEQIYPESEVANLFGVSPATIARIRKKGDLPFVEIGRRYFYSEAHLLAWFDKRAEGSIDSDSQWTKRHSILTLCLFVFTRVNPFRESDSNVFKIELYEEIFCYMITLIMAKNMSNICFQLKNDVNGRWLIRNISAGLETILGTRIKL